MADGLNKVMLLGSLGADPELRNTTSGEAILSLRVATSESYLDRNKARQERTEWHRVTVWGKRGEALAKFLKKGSKVFIEGGLRTTSYEKDGQKVYKTEINATNVIMCGGGGKSDAREESDYTPSKSGRGPALDAPPDDSDIPF